MCGIVGYHGNGSKQILFNMLDKIKHRGRDNTGIKIFKSCGLGHQRLSIIDLSKKGNQPMSKSNIHITFNGEIYNFKELKLFLDKKYRFTSNSDTEVLIYLYKEYGTKMLEKIEGMFAFVIYDEDKDLFFGARDRLGEKPLRYYHDKASNFFAFASESKSLLTLIKKPTIDPVAIKEYLQLQYIRVPRTGFKEIKKLGPGQFFLYSKNKLSINNYWNAKLNLSKATNLYETLKNSVNSRLLADVEVGSLLSGGIDSSFVVALASKKIKNLKTFHIKFNESQFDESKYVELVKNKYKVQNKNLLIDIDNLEKSFYELVDFYDEPIGDNSILPTFHVCKELSKEVKVALNGDGGDENFGGYDRYSIVKMSDYFVWISKIPLFYNFVKKSTNLFHSIFNNRFSYRMNIFFSTLDKDFFQRYIHYSSFFTSDELDDLLITNELIHFGDKNDKLSSLQNVFLFDINNYLPENLLFKTDIASMAHTLELRAPLLNYQLIEKTLNLPDNKKINLFDKKYIFKRIILKNKIFDKNFLYRKKMGFNIPVDSWLRNHMKSFVFKHVLSEKMKSIGLFDMRKLEIFLNDYFDKNFYNYNKVFALLMLSLWIEKYFDGVDIY